MQPFVSEYVPYIMCVYTCNTKGDLRIHHSGDPAQIIVCEYMWISAQIIVCAYMYTYIVYMCIYSCICASIYPIYLRARHACRRIYLHLYMKVGIRIYINTLIYSSVKPTAGDCASCVPTYVDL